MIDLPPPVAVPDLRGLTVEDAATRLRAAGLRPEGGTRLQWRDGRFVPAPAGRVTSQSLHPGARAVAGDTVTVGTTGPKIDVERWSRIGFERGRIVLGDLSRACVRYDHATIAAPSNGARVIRLWGMRVKGCEPARRLELDPPAGWTVHTNAAPFETPALVNPWLTAERRRALDALGPEPDVILMPDRRSVLAFVGRGACDGIAAASATLRGRTLRVRVTLGSPPGPKGWCTAIRESDSVLIRLREPAPLGVALKRSWPAPPSRTRRSPASGTTRPAPSRAPARPAR